MSKPAAQTCLQKLPLLFAGRFQANFRHIHSAGLVIPLPPLHTELEIDHLGSKWVLCRTDQGAGEALSSEPVLGQLIWARQLLTGAEAFFQLDPTSPTTHGNERRTLLLRSWIDRATGKRRIFARVCSTQCGEEISTVEWLRAR